MPRFELSTHRPKRTGPFGRRARQIRIHDDDGRLVLTCPTILRTTRRAEYPLTGELAERATLIRTSWGRFRLVDQPAGELARFVMRSPRPGRRLRPSWELRPIGGGRIVLVSDVPMSTIEGLKRDLRNEILATYRCDDGFHLDVYSGHGELTIEPSRFPATIQVGLVAGIVARALHTNPTP